MSNYYRKGPSAAEVGFGCAALFNVALIIAVIAVVWHFVAKFW